MRRLCLNLGEYRPVLNAQWNGVWRWDQALELKSQPGILRIGFWGCGSAFTTRNHQSNLVIIKGETVVFLDLGTKLPIKLAEFGLSMHDVEHVVITHSHADHAGSLEELGLRRRYEAPLFMVLREGLSLSGPEAEKTFQRMREIRASGMLRPKLYVPEEYAKELWDQTLRGGMAYSEEIGFNGSDRRMELAHFFDLQKLIPVPEQLGRPAWRFSVGNGQDRIDFFMYVSPHIPESAHNLNENFFSCGLVVDNRVMISGDTRFDPEALMKLGASCETIFNDCQSFPGGVHVNYDELSTLDPRIRGKMLLYHFDDGMWEVDHQGRYRLKDIQKDGFLGFAEPIPIFYEWD